MMGPFELRQRLTKALSGMGVLLPTDRLLPAEALVKERGRARAKELREQIGRWRFAVLLRTIRTRYAADDLARVLGFGEIVTEFLIGPATLVHDRRGAITYMGMLANLIVTLFDRVIDLGEKPTRVLAAAVARGERRTRFAWPTTRGVIEHLVGSYYTRLGELPEARAALLRRTIGRMYAAEMATGCNGVACSPLLLMRKNALPFVVMYLPAWDPTHRDRRLSSVYRFGDLLGWIDDVVDLPSDVASGHPNRVERALRAGVDVDVVIARIARRAEVTRSHWPSREGDVVDALSLCVSSWMNT